VAVPASTVLRLIDFKEEGRAQFCFSAFTIIFKTESLFTLVTRSQNITRIMNRPPPINRLPPDTLSRIFWYAANPKDQWGFQREPGLSDARALFKIGNVCSKWHQITRSSPQL
jgi:hypothetical protein